MGGDRRAMSVRKATQAARLFHHHGGRGWQQTPGGMGRGGEQEMGVSSRQTGVSLPTQSKDSLFGHAGLS